jgi:DNA ligase 1
MLAKPTKGIREVLNRFENMKFTCEYKYDGFRAQIHYNRANVGSEVFIYSRNLENMTHQYPDVVEVVLQAVKSGIDNFILDSELVPYDTANNKILSFALLTQRSRKHVNAEDLKTKISIFAFDMLYLNNHSLLKQNLCVRRDLLH